MRTVAINENGTVTHLPTIASDTEIQAWVRRNHPGATYDILNESMPSKHNNMLNETHSHSAQQTELNWMVEQEIKDNNGRIPAFVRDGNGNWSFNGSPEIEEAMANMTDQIVEGKVLEVLADIQDELAETRAIAELADEKSSAVYESLQNLVESIQEFHDGNVTPYLDAVEELSDWAQEAEGENETAFKTFLAIADLLRLDTKEIARRVRDLAVDRGSAGSGFTRNVPDSNHARNLASVSGGGPRQPVGSSADREGYRYQKESVNGSGASPLVEATLQYINNSSKYR